MQFGDLTHWPLGDLNEIFMQAVFTLILVIDVLVISCEIALKLMSPDPSDNK